MNHALTLSPLRQHPDLIATVSDRIWQAWRQNSGVSLADLTAKMAEIAQGDSLPQAVVALIGGRYAGSALLIASDDDAYPYLSPWIAAVWVEPEFRRQGVARTLMADLRDRAAAAGIACVYLGAQADKISFYQNLGYQLIHTDTTGAGVFSFPLQPSTRPERPEDIDAIATLTTQAFLTAQHSSGTEAAIVAALRTRGDLALSLVVEEAGEIIGHVAFSPVQIGGEDHGWLGLGPVSVAPAHQGRGIGAELIRQALNWLRVRGAKGCVLLGNPNYYGRFGFAPDPAITYPGPPAEYFQVLAFGEDRPKGIVSYSPAFG